jgi:hypothetical protein
MQAKLKTKDLVDSFQVYRPDKFIFRVYVPPAILSFAKANQGLIPKQIWKALRIE